MPVKNTNWQGIPDGAPFNTTFAQSAPLANLVHGTPQDVDNDTKAPSIKPYPIDRIDNQLFDIYEDLMAAKDTIILSIKTSILNEPEKNILKKNLKKVKEMIQTIKDMSKDLEQITL